MTMTRAEVETSWGRIPVRRGGAGPVVLLVHGLLVDGGLWDEVAARLVAAGFDLGGPRQAPGAPSVTDEPGTNASPSGVARLVDTLARELGLRDVTLVGNDTGGAICQLVAAEQPAWLAGLVLTPCDAYENFLPPAFRPLQVLARRAPRVLVALVQPMRLRAVRRSPLGFGWLSKRGVGDERAERWMRPFLDVPATRRDVVRTLAAIDSADTVAAAARLGQLGRPVAIAWADGDRFFPRRLAERLAGDIPGATLTRIDDAYAFTPIDQPEATTRPIAELVARTAGAESRAA